MKFYLCENCNNIITLAHTGSQPISCCGEQIKELLPHTKDVGNEKHLPVVEINGSDVCVKVGSVEHPMLENHYINLIALETKNGNQIVELKPEDKPEAHFSIVDGDKVIAAYEYCNLHGLWKTEL